MKTFAIDENPIEIEELSRIKCLNNENKCCNKNKTCTNTCNESQEKKIHIINEDNEWFSPKTLDDFFNLLSQYKNVVYRFVGGNTSIGVFKNDGPFNIFIDFKSIPDFFLVTKTASDLTIGSAITLTKLVDILNKYSTESGFEYLKVIAFHITKIAVSYKLDVNFILEFSIKKNYF